VNILAIGVKNVYSVFFRRAEEEQSLKLATEEDQSLKLALGQPWV